MSYSLRPGFPLANHGPSDPERIFIKLPVNGAVKTGTKDRAGWQCYRVDFSPTNFRMLSLRIVVVIHALGIVIQSALAGLFLSGSVGPVVLHEWTAWGLLAIAAVQVGLSLVQSKQTRGLVFAISSLFVLLAEVLQTGTGYGRFLGVHIPLSVVLFGAVAWQLGEIFRPEGRA